MENKFGRGFVPGMGAYNPEIAFIGQSVGKYEVESGRPFTGPAGEMLDEILDNCGISRSEIYLTNVLKYQPLNELKLERWQDFESVERLWDELAKINPKKIVCLGNIPTYFITGKKGIQEYRGSLLRSKRLGKLTIGTYNPAHLLYQTGGEISSYWQKGIIEFDIKRLKRSPLDWQPPYRNLIVAKNSADLMNWMERHSNLDECSTDIETYHCTPACISFSCKKTEAISVPLFQTLYGLPISTIPKRDLVEIWHLIDKILRTKKIIGQNFKFDQERLEHELFFEIGTFYADTMLMAHVLNPELPKSIAFLASLLTEEPFWKDEGRDFNPKKDDIKDWLLYNAKDAAVTKEVFDAELEDLKKEGLFDYYFGYYHHLHDLYYELENRGLNVNESRREELILKYKEALEINNQRLETVLGFIPNVNSPKDCALAVYESLHLPRRESLDEDSLVSLLANHAKTIEQRVALQGIIDGRRIRKLLGPDRLQFKVDWDGKAKSNYRISGAETGRRSTNLLKPPLRMEKIGLSFHAMSKHSEIGKDFRTMFVPPPGFIFINQDLSQAEARVVALLSNDEDTLELFDTIDIHKWTAAIYLELAITREFKSARAAIENKEKVNEALKAIKSDERFVAKFVRHGSNYGMRKHRLMIEINTNAKKFKIPVNISEYRAGKLLETFHNFNPKIRSVFHKEIEMCIRETRTLIGPFGDKRYFFERIGDDLFKEANAHIPQNTVSNQIGHAMLAIKKEMPDLQILIESHDAILWQAPENEWKDRAKITKKYLEQPIDFSNCSLKRGVLVIPSDIEIGMNYGEMEKASLC